MIEVAFDEPPSGSSNLMAVFVGVDGLSMFRDFIGVVLADVGVANVLSELDLLFLGVDGGVLSFWSIFNPEL
jgi:hypothetical protein